MPFDIKIKSKRTSKKTPPHPALDLFGEVPVTQEEVLQWCEVVAGIARDSWRLRWYLASWNIPDKIRAAKLAGQFDALIAAGLSGRALGAFFGLPL